MKLLLPLVEVEKTDYYGVPYKTKVLGHPKRDYGTMWKKHLEMTERNNKEMEGVYQVGSINRSYVEREVNKDIEESFG